MPRIIAVLFLIVAASATAADLHVMSFNIRYGTATDGVNMWAARRDLVVRTIETAAPDLLGTQECLAFQRDYLVGGLPEYAVVSVGRDDGDEAGEMCACFYRVERFKREATGTFWLSDTPEVVGSVGWDAALPRIATWLRLREWDSDREILWLNTHFDHVGEQARLESLKLINAWLTANRGEATIIVTGDFNLPGDPSPDGAPQLLQGDLLQDTWTAVHGAEPEVGTFNGFGINPRPGRIDWILTSLDVDVKKARIDRTRYDESWPSDHCPVIAVVELD